MARIDELTFCSVVVEGEKHHRDILIFADGTVRKRKDGLLPFDSREMAQQELDELS